MKYCPNCGFNLTSMSTEPGVPSQDTSGESVGTQNTNIIDSYSTFEGEEVEKAVPVVSDYRERYKKQQIRVDEVSPKRTLIEKVPRQDSELDTYRYKGDSLFFGPGTETEY